MRSFDRCIKYKLIKYKKTSFCSDFCRSDVNWQMWLWCGMCHSKSSAYTRNCRSTTWYVKCRGEKITTESQLNYNGNQHLVKTWRNIAVFMQLQMCTTIFMKNKCRHLFVNCRILNFTLLSHKHTANTKHVLFK